jgi:hypothetical protein
MRPRSVSLALALTGLVAVMAAPALAQDAPTFVSYGGVGFSFAASLGSSVDITQVPAITTTAQEPFQLPQSAHLAFTLYGPTAEDAGVPRVGDETVTVRFYRTADMAAVSDESRDLGTLTRLLASRADLGPYMVIMRNSTDELPYQPSVAASQVLRARVQYVDAPQVSGISFIAGYRQDVSGFARGDFSYTFQGLSHDGSWYVSVVAYIQATMFPAVLNGPGGLYNSDRAWVAYLNGAIAKLNAGRPRAFKPSLVDLDDLVNSITFAIDYDALPSSSPSEVPSETAAPAGSPSPTGSAPPSGAPSPSASGPAGPPESAAPLPSASAAIPSATAKP